MAELKKKKSEKIPRKQSVDSDETSISSGRLVQREQDIKPIGLHRPQGFLKWTAFLLSFFVPWGLLFGILYYSQPNDDSKRFGKICLILSGIGALVWILSSLMHGLSSSELSGLMDGYF